jgi:hypothetical protein
MKNYQDREFSRTSMHLMGSGQDSRETLGWVSGNQHRKKGLFKSPHPNPFDFAQGILLPEGEGVIVLKLRVLGVQGCMS